MKINSFTQFMCEAAIAVFNMAAEGLDPTDNVEFVLDDVYEVTHSFVLGNQKAMFLTTLPDGKYYEVTYNTEKNEIYVDQYTKTRNETITVTESTEEENED
jgi:hypothetical protein